MMTIRIRTIVGLSSLLVCASVSRADSIVVTNIPVDTPDFGYLSSASNSFPLLINLTGGGAGGGENINGAIFNAGAATGTGAGTVAYSLTSLTLTGFTSAQGFAPGATNPTYGAAINQLLSSFYYGGGDQSVKNETLTITGLTPGQTATLTVLGAAFLAGATSGREETLSGTAGSTITNYMNAASTPVNTYEENNGQFSTVAYTALVPANGTISLTSTATDNVPSTLHYYGFTVSQTPEPASLGLLGFGALGLLRRQRRA